MVTVERRERPILDILGVSVFDGIEPAIIDMGPQVALVANEVLPIAPLPDATLAARFLTALTSSHFGIDFENRILIQRQRTGKFVSPSGSVQTAWR